MTPSNAVGGIIGHVDQYITVDQSKNEGNVSGFARVGGIVGLLANSPALTNDGVANVVTIDTTISCGAGQACGGIIGEAGISASSNGIFNGYVRNVNVTDGGSHIKVGGLVGNNEASSGFKFTNVYTHAISGTGDALLGPSATYNADTASSDVFITDSTDESYGGGFPVVLTEAQHR